MGIASAPAWDKLAFTAGLDASHLERLASIAQPVEWESGITVYREGDAGSPVYLVEQGRVSIELGVPGRGPVLMLTVGDGEIFGWSSLFHERPKGAAARTTAPTRAWAFDSARLRALCDADPAFGYALTRRLLEVVSERLKASRIQLIDIFQT